LSKINGFPGYFCQLEAAFTLFPKELTKIIIKIKENRNFNKAKQAFFNLT